MKTMSAVLAGSAAVLAAAPAFADAVSPGQTANYTVQATSSIYQVFGHAGNPGGGGTSTDAVQTTFAAGSGNVFTFNATGIISCCSGSDASGPDGGTGNTSVNGANGLSGLSGNSRVPLVGVFTSEADPFGKAAPASLTFDATGTSGLSPLLNQVFYIGDGHAGNNDSMGASLLYTAPDEATRLYIGILDAFDFTGDPGFYGDNTGSLAVSVSLAGGGETGAVPEPATWAMMVLGFGVAGFALRRQVRRSEERFDAKIKRIAADHA